MNIGDLVRYRDWKLGDPEIESVPIDSRSWGAMGVVTLITESSFGKEKNVPSAEYLPPEGDFHLAKISDLILLNKN